MTELAAEQPRTLAENERIIERGLGTFVEVGQALTEIRDGRQYRETHATFEDYCRERWGFSRQRANQLVEAAEAVGALTTMVDTAPLNERQARALSPVLKHLGPQAAAEILEEQAATGKITASGITRAAMNRALTLITPTRRIDQNGGRYEWYTPPEYIDAARKVYGPITTDPATSAKAQTWINAEHAYTEADNGLQQEWRGNVWLNPPFANTLITAFLDKLHTEYEAGRVTAAITLTHNATETAWGQSLLARADAVCLKRGRVRFLDADGRDPEGAALQGQMFTYLGPEPDVFAAVFQKHGVVLR